jgi:hypothetical protein
MRCYQVPHPQASVSKQGAHRRRHRPQDGPARPAPPPRATAAPPTLHTCLVS